MLSFAEFSRATYGAWRLALLDADGLRYFDDTIGAYWQSFQAAVILAPAYAILVALRLSANPTEAGVMQVFLVEVIAYVINWTALPLVMIYVCDKMGRYDRYLRFVVAHNWSAVIQMAVFLAAMMLARGVLGSGLGAMLNFTAVIAILAYQWFVARTALGIDGLPAAAIVGLDLVISIVLNSVTGRFV